MTSRMTIGVGSRILSRRPMTHSHSRRIGQFLDRVFQQRPQQAPPPSHNQHNSRGWPMASSAADFHSFALQRQSKDEDNDEEHGRMEEQRRQFHSTPPSERAVAAMLGLATLSAVGYAGSSAIQSYQEFKAAQPSPEELEEMKKEEAEEQAKRDAQAAAAPKDEPSNSQQTKEGTSGDQPRENFFKKFFDVGTKYYEGGFEDGMTKREAALILGVRESASHRKIKDAYRNLLVLNHPDTGGSTYLSLKINEAKELLLKGRARV